MVGIRPVICWLFSNESGLGVHIMNAGMKRKERLKKVEATRKRVATTEFDATANEEVEEFLKEGRA